MKNFLRLHFLLVLFIATFFIPCITFASEMLFVPSAEVVAKGDLVKVNIYVLPGEDRINAAEGKIIFPKSLLAVSNISYGNSILSFWPQAPEDKGNGVIAFSGVTPGGYASSGRGLLFSVIFNTLNEGNATLEIKEALVLKDDGLGSATVLKLGSGNISIIKKVANMESKTSSALTKELDVTNDHELPESFIPLVGSDQSIFNGKYFLVFSTIDKQSGIDHYEVQESKSKSTRNDAWIIAESPYLLSDQIFHSFVFVRAIDRAQNVRIEIMPPLYPQKFYQSAMFWVIIVLIFLLLFFWRRKFSSSLVKT